MEPKFIHLRLHTEYSLTDGLLLIPYLLEKTAAFNMPALAITDLGNLYATVKFYQEAFRVGIKPLIGADFWLTQDKNAKTVSRLTLICQNNTGYKNLVKLISRSFLEGQFLDKP